MADAQVRSCKCKNDYQDRIYGNGMRIYNPNAKGGSRCTVCGTTHGAGEKKK